MRKWAAVLAVLVLATTVAEQARATQPSAKQVHELLQVMHMNQVLGEMNSQVIGMMGQTLPCVPATHWQDFIDAEGTKQLMDQMVPIYQRHFTAKDIAGLLKFYKSPLGQKVLTKMPETMAEGMKIGQAWGRQRAQAMIGELQQAGTLDANGRCPASVPVPSPKSAEKP